MRLPRLIIGIIVLMAVGGGALGVAPRMPAAHATACGGVRVAT